MKITFRKVSIGDLPKFAQWYATIDGAAFFSHAVPSSYTHPSQLTSDRLLWYIIVHDNEEIGTVWLEAKDPETSMRDIGIYLNSSEHMGKSIGRQVLWQLLLLPEVSHIDKSTIGLNVRANNTRAIRCYTSAGFIKTSSGTKEIAGQEVRYYRMSLNAQPSNKPRVA